MQIEIKNLLNDFQEISGFAGITISENDILIETLLAPHRPPSLLPNGKMAVYIFFWNEKCLKVGKVGQNSNARYTSQHYNPRSSNSNLAKSILLGKDKLGLPSVSETNVGAWIKSNTDRINILLDSRHGIPALTLLESFFQCRLRPYFEGFESQH